MADQLDIFNFIREQGGTVKLMELKQKFHQIPDLEKVLEAYNSLFWISKITENHWEVRAKLDVELCTSYLQGGCNGGCECLHICKSFLLGGEKFCKQPCKNGFSHDIKDVHNKAVLHGYSLDDYGMNLLRASFPRLCTSFQKSGKCKKHFCGYIHLCRLFAQGKCTNECQFAATTGLSKQDVHGLTLPHNSRVFSSFDLAQKKREILLGNILFCSDFEGYNQSETEKNSPKCQANLSSKVFERNFHGNIQRPLICGFYLSKKCNKGNDCKRLHICKEFLMPKSMRGCPSIICQYGFSHDPFDENNAKIIKSKWTETDQSKIIDFLRQSFPRFCQSYEKGDCIRKHCQKLHICGSKLFNICQTNYCSLSHDIADEHNSNIFKRYNLDFLLKMPIIHVLPNILISKRSRFLTNVPKSAYANLSKSSQSTSKALLSQSAVSVSEAESQANGDTMKKIIQPSVENVLSYILNNFNEGYCMLSDAGFQSLFPEGSEEKIYEWCKLQQRYFRLNHGMDNSVKIYPCFVDVEPCSFYWRKASEGTVTESKCTNKKCGKFHICKRLVLGQTHNHSSCSHNHSFENKIDKQLIKNNKLESYTDQQILLLLQNRFPFVCSNYQTNSCAEGEKYCSMLHICQNFLTKKCSKTEDICGLNHQTALAGKQAERIVKEFHLPMTRLQNLLLLKSTNQKPGASSFKGKNF